MTLILNYLKLPTFLLITNPRNEPPNVSIPRPQLQLGVVLTLMLPSAALGQEPRRAPADTARHLPAVEVIGTSSALRRIPGSGIILETTSTPSRRPVTASEVLRRAPGIHVREEEGLGLRPNISVRGLNPNRSAGVLLLEDGLPMTIAPYGDNAAYYHPPITRFARIEVLKGSGQILFGPRTVGGVINYVTPDAPTRPGGAVRLAGGGAGYFLSEATYGGNWNGNALLLHATHQRGRGARANTGAELTDLSLKAGLALGDGHLLTLKANHFVERTNATYASLTEAEYAADPRQNPFRHDSLFLDRTAGSATLRSLLGPAVLTTTAYAYGVSRAWWRQANSSTERPLDRNDPACGGMANLSTTCGIQGAPRQYFIRGLEPRLAFGWRTGSAWHALEVGARLHAERQERQTIGGAHPNARTAGPASNPGSGITEDNLRTTTAYSAWLQDRIAIGAWTLSPGVRLEAITSRRTNRLPVPDSPTGVSGSTTMVEVIPGLGLTRGLGEETSLYAGIHRGFAPPRTEDLISNTTGGVVELNAELSWNTELGVRTAALDGSRAEVTLFRMDFENQIIPANLAGGTGATLTSAGRTLHAGVEVAAELSGARVASSLAGLRLDLAWTWLPVARYEGPRFAWIGTGGSDVVGKVYAAQNGAGTRTEVRVSGHRLPNAPEHLLTAGLQLEAGAGTEVGLEAVHVARQFGDAANTTVTVPDGQQGVIPAATWWNLTASRTLPALRSTAYLSVKNLFDATYLVDRSRGMLPGMMRTVQVGVRTGF